MDEQFEEMAKHVGHNVSIEKVGHIPVDGKVCRCVILFCNDCDEELLTFTE